MNAPAIITAACVAIGAASIATSAKADPLCDFGAALVENAVTLRAAGLPQENVASLQAAIIGQSISDSDLTPAARQTAAAISGTIATMVLQAAYSYPLEPSIPADLQSAIAAEAFLDGCEGR